MKKVNIDDLYDNLEMAKNKGERAYKNAKEQGLYFHPGRPELNHADKLSRTTIKMKIEGSKEEAEEKLNKMVDLIF